jgi:hypothetical protein
MRHVNLEYEIQFWCSQLAVFIISGEIAFSFVVTAPFWLESAPSPPGFV